jgi:hypothetical protein
LGEVEEARRHLDTAMRNSVTVRERALYAAKLRSIEPAALLPAAGEATRRN